MTQRLPINIRAFDFSDAAYEALVRIHKASIEDSSRTVETWKADDETRDKSFLFQRIIAELNGEIVAFASYEEPWWSNQPNRYFIYIMVHPAYRKQGIGSALYDWIMRALSPNASTVFASSTRSSQPDGVRFLEKRGFHLTLREPISQLDVTTFDPVPFEAVVNNVKQLQISIFDGTELIRRDPLFWRKIYDFDAILMQDVPTSDPYTPPHFEHFVKNVSDERRGFISDGWFIAVVGNDYDPFHSYVARSSLIRDLSNPQKLKTGLTGVLREYRRKGIATALKVQAIEFAKTYRATLIETENEENNPMYNLNVALGFQETNAYLDYEMRFLD